jgi:hypothetical protein
MMNKKIVVACSCVLLTACNQSAAPVAEQQLPFQEKIESLCAVYRTDLYGFAEKAATTRLDAEFTTSLKTAEDTSKLLTMLNCRRWKPS